MLLAVRISGYGCTWEVWRGLKKLELPCLRLEQFLRIFRALQTSRVHPQLYTHAKHEQILKLPS